MSRLTILGGGAAGLSAAYFAHRAGVEFELFERDLEPGGMCRTLRRGGHLYDAGAHRFHDLDAEITAEVKSLLGGELRPVRAPSRIWTGGRYVDFPPTPLNAALSHGWSGAARIALELLTARRSRGPAASFEDFALQRFGPTLARRLLLDYAEKLWGLPAARLSPEVATRRLRGMTLRTLVVELFASSRKTAHIDGEFLYPCLGYGQIAGRLAAALPEGRVFLGREIRGLELDGRRVSRVRFKDGGQIECADRVLSTLPLTLLARLLGDALPGQAREAASRLRFRRLRLVFLRLSQPRVSDNASIYFPEPRFCVSRVSEPKNRSQAMAPADETSLLAEVPCFDGDALDRMPDAALAARVIAELESVGLLCAPRVLDWAHELLPHAYPVYSLDFERDARAVI